MIEFVDIFFINYYRRGSYYFKTRAKSPYGNKITDYSWGLI